MMRSPSLALRPVVSVSRTTWRVILWNPFIRQSVCALIFRMPGVAAHPVPLYLMLGGELVERFPEVDVLHRFLVRGAPAAALPVVDPGRDALLHVRRVRIEAHPASARERRARACGREGRPTHANLGAVQPEPARAARAARRKGAGEAPSPGHVGTARGEELAPPPQRCGVEAGDHDLALRHQDALGFA